MRKVKKRAIMYPDLTPLIDVVFLLLIFFMISTTFNKYGKFDITLPQSDIVEKSENSAMEIIIDKNGNYFIMKGEESVQVEFDQLENHLSGVEEVTISGDKDIKYHLVTDVLNKVKKMGIEKIGINFYE
ncbi:ExbD/TolR family protein [Fusobacterium sp. PH5-44]|uniref:ExbD/TolR family protein n=1 Tax=unclassified Fusobacterium TaxID=2648384 RepID=UPI003D23A415